MPEVYQYNAIVFESGFCLTTCTGEKPYIICDIACLFMPEVYQYNTIVFESGFCLTTCTGEKPYIIIM